MSATVEPTARPGGQLPPVEPPTEVPEEARRRRTHETGFGEARPHWLAYVVLGVGLIIVTSPFIWMALSSLKSEGEIRQVPPTWIPEAPTLDNFRELFDRLDFTQFFTNSTVVALAVTIGNVIFCSMLGYVLAKSEFAGKKLLFRLVLGTLMVPGMVTLVPLFVLVANMGLVNTYFGLILPFLAAPFGVFLMRQFFLGIPDELIDAARVDGASEARIFVQVVMPLAKPALATLGILTFLGSWNNFLWPLVVATTEDKYTLPVALALYSTGQNQTDYGLLLAGAVVVVVPGLIVFLILQRHFVLGGDPHPQRRPARVGLARRGRQRGPANPRCRHRARARRRARRAWCPADQRALRQPVPGRDPVARGRVRHGACCAPEPRSGRTAPVVRPGCHLPGGRLGHRRAGRLRLVGPSRRASCRVGRGPPVAPTPARAHPGRPADSAGAAGPGRGPPDVVRRTVGRRPSPRDHRRRPPPGRRRAGSGTGCGALVRARGG